MVSLTGQKASWSWSLSRWQEWTEAAPSLLLLSPFHFILFLARLHTLHDLQTRKHEQAVIILEQKAERSLSEPPKDKRAHGMSMPCVDTGGWTNERPVVSMSAQRKDKSSFAAGGETLI